MKVKCLYNTGEALRQYENINLEKEMLGRFGTTGYSQYNELVVRHTKKTEIITLPK